MVTASACMRSREPLGDLAAEDAHLVQRHVQQAFHARLQHCRQRLALVAGGLDARGLRDGRGFDHARQRLMQGLGVSV